MKLLADVSDEAELDTAEIIAYYNEQKEDDTLGRRFQGAVNSTVQKLCQSPESGTKCTFKNPKYAGIRVKAIDKPFNRYIIFFRQKGETLQIIRIMHGARNYETLFK